MVVVVVVVEVVVLVVVVVVTGGHGVVVVGRAVVVVGGARVVEVVVGGAGHSPTKLKGLAFFSCLRFPLPIAPCETQFTQFVAVQLAGVVPGQRQNGFLRSVRT